MRWDKIYFVSHKLQTSNISQKAIRRLDDGDRWYDTGDRWDEKHLKTHTWNTEKFSLAETKHGSCQ